MAEAKNLKELKGVAETVWGTTFALSYRESKNAEKAAKKADDAIEALGKLPPRKTSLVKFIEGEVHRAGADKDKTGGVA